MKTLVLCVDRDDDLGRKAQVETPVVGRRRVVDAALALGLADPEDSDTNALLASIHLYDREVSTAEPDDIFEVAAIAGHGSVGLRSDRELSRQLDEVLALTQADEVILVSDGAEDEQILPILQSRVRVAHVKRSIVKQAPRIEGFIYTMRRMLDEQQFGIRYLLPLALVFGVWAIAAAFGWFRFALSMTLAIIGAWFFVHALQWEERVGQFFEDLVKGLRAGKMALVGTIIMAVIFIVGLVQAIGIVPNDQELSLVYRVLLFIDSFLFYAISGLLVRTAGALLDEVFAEGKASLSHWTFAFTLIAFGFIAGVLVDLSIAVMGGVGLDQAISLDLVVRLLVGFAIMASGIVISRYVKSFFVDEPARN